MENGDFIRIDFIGRIESGEIFDLTKEDVAKKENIHNENMRYKPLPIIIGAGFVIPGLDKELKKMNVGEKKTLTIEPKDAFGERNAELVRVVPLKNFRNPPVPGQVVDLGDARGRVQSVSGGRVRVDFNHPLAGKKLVYEVDLIEKIEKTEDKAKAILEFFGYSPDDKALSLNDKELNLTVEAPSHVKQKIASLAIEFIHLDKVNFVQTYSKGEIRQENQDQK